MNKTLRKKLIVSKEQIPARMEKENSSEQLMELMQDMKGVWREAATDLLQPRPEAVAQLLKKVLH
ncbi:MAG: hypothetical protein EOP56_13145 [Sphingobacteriales bacterium]|nr:MAG: hypothetical protein EOP56_13145 [Sphingobacteriales bacterium]